MTRIKTMLLVLGALVGCGDLAPPTGPLGELERNELLWESARPVSYVYAVERLCFCGDRGPVRITVEGTAVTERIYVETGLPTPPASADRFPAVEGLFELLRAALEGGAHEVRVTYDPELGIPVDFWIDYVENAIDEELGMQVTEDLVPL